MAADGLITIRSSYGPKDTMDRFETEVKASSRYGTSAALSQKSLRVRAQPNRPCPARARKRLRDFLGEMTEHRSARLVVHLGLELVLIS